MKRLLAGFALATVMATGIASVTPASVAAQPSNACQACRAQFTTCMQRARTPAQAATCRATAVACLKAAGCSAD